MRFFVLRGALAATILAGPALAQVPAPLPATAPAVAPRTSVGNDDFRRLALLAEYFDYESSRLAIQRSSRRAIKTYAAALVGNFRSEYGRLTAGGGPFSSYPALPADPNAPVQPFVDDRRAAMLNQLNTASGREFDRLYTDMQFGMRQEVLGLYETYVQSGSDPALLAFARSQLPVLAQEYQYARKLAGR